MKRVPLLLLPLALTACAASDDDLKQEAAKACGISPSQFTLWEVRRNPSTKEPEGVAYSGVDRNCMGRWLDEKKLNTIMY
jgi:hypothetical protein